MDTKLKFAPRDTPNHWFDFIFFEIAFSSAGHVFQENRGAERPIYNSITLSCRVIDGKNLVRDIGRWRSVFPIKAGPKNHGRSLPGRNDNAARGRLVIGGFRSLVGPEPF